MLTTEEILALRRLGRTVDRSWIEWAIEMLVEGHDSPSLRIMAGETPPFHPFEMWQMVDRVFAELGLTPFADQNQAAMALTTVRVQQMLGGQVSHEDGLADIAQLYVELDYFPAPLNDFYLLYHALDDLHYGSVQFHWPEGDRGTIHSIIDRRCRSWLADRATRASAAGSG